VLLPVLSSMKHNGACAEDRLSLPLWFVFDRQPKVPPEHPPCDDARSTLAFSATENLTAFLQARRGGRWKIELASTWIELAGMVADLHERAEHSVCLDPELDGSGGEPITLAQLLEFCEKKSED
jgi:hypothetical protein